jgi:hypothetical protein
MKTCRHGHPQTPENTAIDKRGYRDCRVCRREKARARYERQFRALTPYQHQVLSSR